MRLLAFDSFLGRLAGLDITCPPVDAAVDNDPADLVTRWLMGAVASVAVADAGGGVDGADGATGGGGADGATDDGPS